MTLYETELGKKYEVISIDVSENIKRRIFDIGITKGSFVTPLFCSFSDSLPAIRSYRCQETVKPYLKSSLISPLSINISQVAFFYNNKKVVPRPSSKQPTKTLYQIYFLSSTVFDKRSLFSAISIIFKSKIYIFLRIENHL